MLNISEIFNAAAVLKGVARKTDIIPANRLDCGCDLYLKTENLQLTGSFKLRGAYYKISQLSDEERPRVSLPARPATTRRALPWARPTTASRL